MSSHNEPTEDNASLLKGAGAALHQRGIRIDGREEEPHGKGEALPWRLELDRRDVDSFRP